MRIQEDDVLEVASHFLEDLGFRVLALGGNQAGLFSFKTKNGRRKYPDLVASREKIIVVFEAKVQSSGLFAKPQEKDQSDYEALLYLLSSKKTQKYLIEQAKNVLKGLGIQGIDEMVMHAGLITAGSFKNVMQMAKDNQVILLGIDVRQFHVDILRDQSSLLKHHEES